MAHEARIVRHLSRSRAVQPDKPNLLANLTSNDAQRLTKISVLCQHNRHVVQILPSVMDEIGSKIDV